MSPPAPVLAAASASMVAAMTDSQPSQYRPVGIVLAVSSGLLIGCSFVLKKKGLLRSQKGHEAGKGVAYLKSPMWWTGMIMMICGELCNFGAYAFVEAILVTPLGALSVVICAIMSHFFLNERLTLFGWIGCAQCILGSIIIALNGPQEQSVSTIIAFRHLFLAPWFLAFGGACIAAALTIIFFIAPKYGQKTMLWYISVCSLIGGISVSCTQGLGACIVTSIRGENQFKNWFTYFLLVFVTITLLTEIYYLNVALALFNTAMVTPTYYVLFTFCTLVTSVILYEGLKASAAQIITIVLAFFVICSGIFILQMSKVDPETLTNVDRKTSILLRVAREEVKLGDSRSGEDVDEKHIEATEEPGMDAIVGRFGAIGGTVVRARRRATIISNISRRSINSTTVNSNGAPSIASHDDEHRFLSSSFSRSDSHKANSPPTSPKRGDDLAASISSTALPHDQFSSFPMVLSPLPTPASEGQRVSSIKFADSIDEIRSPLVRTANTPNGNDHQHQPPQVNGITGLPPPPAALVSYQNTSLPSLHLPTPSLHITHSVFNNILNDPSTTTSTPPDTSKATTPSMT